MSSFRLTPSLGVEGLGILRVQLLETPGSITGKMYCVKQITIVRSYRAAVFVFMLSFKAHAVGRSRWFRKMLSPIPRWRDSKGELQAQ